MADWKTQLSYNYNPSFHAYAYGLVYQPGPGPEQAHGGLPGWGEAGDLSGYNAGVTPGYYTAAAARTPGESPPRSPEQHQGTGVVYLGDAQAGHLLLAGPRRGPYEAGSDSPSDSEAHTSPDSWSSGSSREGSLPHADPTNWVTKDLDDEGPSRSPDTREREDTSSSQQQQQRAFPVPRSEDVCSIASLDVPLTALKKPSAAAESKGKVRAAFSESQMNALVQRFSVQRYLTPAEMKNLAEMTGLTYKQVKTWFQNRRMKLRRHQKDTSWVSERYTTNKDSPGRGGAIFTNIPSHIPPYQGEVKGHYNQHMMEAAFKKASPQNVAFYLAAVGSGSAGYPSWSSVTPQTAVPTRAQAAGWSVPQNVDYVHYEYSPGPFGSTGGGGHDGSFDSRDGEPGNGRSSVNTHGAGQ